MRHIPHRAFVGRSGHGGIGVADALQLADEMRSSGMNVDVLLTESSVKKKFRYADRIGIRRVVVVGADEVRKGKFTLQDMVSGEKRELTLEEMTKLTN